MKLFFKVEVFWISVMKHMQSVQCIRHAVPFWDHARHINTHRGSCSIQQTILECWELKQPNGLTLTQSGVGLTVSLLERLIYGMP